VSDDRVVTEVELEGEQQVVAGFDAIGDSAQRAFAEVDRSAAGALVGLARIERQSTQFGESIRNVGSAVNNFGGRLRSIAATATRYSAVITGLVLASQRLAAAQNQQTDNSKELVAQARLESSAFGDRLERTLANEKALKDLNTQLATGAITASQYGRQYIALVNAQREEEQQARKLQVIREIENEDRIRRTEQLRREQAEQRAFAQSVEAFGADMANGLAQFGNAWNRLMRQFNEGPSIIGDALRFIARFINQNGTEIVAIFNRVGDAFAKLFTDGQGQSRDWAETLIGTIRSIADLITTVLIPALQSIISIANTVATSLNSVFGTSVTGPALILIGIVLQVTGGLRLLAAVVTTLTLGVRLLTGALLTLSLTPVGLAIAAIIVALTAFIAVLTSTEGGWARFVAAAQNAVNSVVQFFTNLPTTISTLFNQLVSVISNLWTSLVTNLNSVWQGFVGFVNQTLATIAQTFTDVWNGLVAVVQAAAARMIQAVLNLIPGLRQLISVIQAAARAWREMGQAQAAASSGDTQGLARGGQPIMGPGTSTSDSILARLSRGEYVIKAAAVRKYGVQLMNMINGMRLPKGKIPGFSGGGPIGFPRFAGGGLALQTVNAGSRGRPIMLQIGREIFEMEGSDETAARLGRYAVNRRLASAGRKPSSMGGN
jgi:hypothetical protein